MANIPKTDSLILQDAHYINSSHVKDDDAFITKYMHIGGKMWIFSSISSCNLIFSENPNLNKIEQVIIT